MAVTKRGKYWHTRFQIAGVKINQSTKCTRRSEAEEFERQLRKQLTKTQGRVRTINDAAIVWLEDSAPRSMYSHIKQMLIHMQDEPLEGAIEAASRMKRKMLKQGLNPQTINRRLACVRTVLNKAYKEYGMLDMPLAGRISPLMLSEKEYAREVFLSQDETATLLEAIEHPEVVKFVLGICATGLRRSEMSKLQPNQYVARSIRLTPKTKGKRGRTVPVPVWAEECFSELPFKCSLSQVRYWFEKARDAINMPDLRLHDLRHTFASWLVTDPAVPLTVVRDLLGHSNLNVTSKYAHLRTEPLRRAVDGILSPKTAQKTAHKLQEGAGEVRHKH